MKRYRVTDRDLSKFDRLLAANQTVDPYGGSTGYFALTGRHGLWLITDGHSAAVECRHPNVPDRNLLFPAWGPDAERFMLQLITQRPELQLARLPSEVASRIGALSLNHAYEVEEDILDWAYPVHTLECAPVSTLVGRRFRNARKEVNYARSAGITLSDLSPSDRDYALAVVKTWTRSQTQDLSDNDYIAPYERAFELLAMPELRVRGVKALQGGQFAGFHIWERPRLGRPTASSLTLCASRAVPGLSEFLVHAACLSLADQGVAEICLGGSETRGLDAFKRKFRPIRSVSLSTMALQKSGAPLAKAA